MKKVYVFLCAALILSGCAQGGSASTESSTAERETKQTEAVVEETTQAASSILDINVAKPTGADEKSVFQAFFKGNSYPADEEIMDVNMQAESGNYRVTVCEALIDDICAYFLVKLETIDGSALPSGDLSMAPEGYKTSLTDIYLNHSVYIYTTNRQSLLLGEIACDRIDGGEEVDTAYFVIGGSMQVDDLEVLSAKPSMVFLVIENITIYRQYYGGESTSETTEDGEKTVEVLVAEELEFDISVTNDASGSIRTFTNGSEGYLSGNGFCTKTDHTTADGIRWTITFDDGTVLRSKDLVSGVNVNSKGILRINWRGVYIDVDKVSCITINGEDYVKE